jgi:hypothetical protein
VIADTRIDVTPRSDPIRSPRESAAAMRAGRARKSGAGGTLLGIFIGMALGLALAAAAATYLYGCRLLRVPELETLAAVAARFRSP